MAKPRIFVVDDESAVRGILRKGLTSFGYQVAKVANGKQALKLLEDQPPDLVILDIIMPFVERDPSRPEYLITVPRHGYKVTGWSLLRSASSR